MKKIISIALLMCTLFIGNVIGQQISAEDYNKEVIHEDFNQAGNIFKIETTTDNYFVLDNGDYLLSRNNNESEYAIIAKNSSVSDFVLKTAVRIGPSKNKKASIGIILKAQKDGKGAIVFEINTKEQYRIKQLKGWSYDNLSGNKRNNGWVKSKMLNGLNEHNLVEIRSENNNYDIYINNNYLTSCSVADYMPGVCGLIISPATKARVSHYYVNSKGESNSNTISSYFNDNTKDQSDLIEELNKKIKILEENNTQLNELSSKTRSNQDKEVTNLRIATSNLENQVKTKENEIQTLNSTIIELKNSNTAFNTETTKLNKQVASIKKQLATEKSVNTHLVNDLDNIISENADISTKLNKEISVLKTKINSIEKAKNNLSTKLSSEKKAHTKIKNELSKTKINNTALQTKIDEIEKAKNNLSTELSSEKQAHTKTKNGLSKTVTKKSTKIKELETELTKINKELSTLRKTQAQHNAVTNSLKNDNLTLHATIDNLNTELTSLKEDISKLTTTNSDLKELFILKDFEANGVKPSELIETTTTLPAPEELVGNKKIYAVQFGVYMIIQPDAAFKELDEVWYETTQNETYVYLSGQFKSPQEATAHKNTLIKLGYPNAFIVTLTK